MDSRAPEFDAQANYDDGTCTVMLEGCTDSSAHNYRLVANLDDASCLFRGCADSLALNFNPTATIPGPCTAVIVGCTNPSAANFYPDANVVYDQFSGQGATCQFIGCTNSARANYDPTATVDSGLCTPVYPGCTDSAALNYNAAYNTDDGSCSIGGCTNPSSGSYNPAATFDDGSCSRRSLSLIDGAGAGEAFNRGARRQLSAGCKDPRASSFDAAATSHSNALCTYDVLGCTASAASNYLAAATKDNVNAPCIFPIFGCTIPEGTLNYDSAATIFLEGRYGASHYQPLSFLPCSRPITLSP